MLRDFRGFLVPSLEFVENGSLESMEGLETIIKEALAIFSEDRPDEEKFLSYFLEFFLNGEK